VGKIVVVWLVFLVLFGVAAWDAGTVMIARFKLQNAAENAAFEAASAFKTTRDLRQAKQAALDQLKQDADGARMTKFRVDQTTGKVTVSLSERVSTVLAGRIGYFKKLTRATASHTSGPPTL
jgi:Flp pilus assembly protein TadG